MDQNKKIAQDFEEFISLVTHDMAAPQRHVREFTKLLLDSFDVPLTDEQHMYRRYIENGLDKLDRMQKALLTYLRVDTYAQPFKKFSLREALDIACVRLEDKIKDTGAVVHLPAQDVFLNGDSEQVTDVFVALFENALLYHTEGVVPVIDVTVQSKEGRIFLEIKDNGIGVSSSGVSKIFEMFRRLHPVDAYGGGVGAGLAIARKIVQRHGGDIQYHAVDGGGSCFIFSFSAAD